MTLTKAESLRLDELKSKPGDQRTPEEKTELNELIAKRDTHVPEPLTQAEEDRLKELEHKTSASEQRTREEEMEMDTLHSKRDRHASHKEHPAHKEKSSKH